jgi:hypothetical protein
VRVQLQLHDSGAGWRDGGNEDPQQLVAVGASCAVAVTPGDPPLERPLLALPHDHVGRPPVVRCRATTLWPGPTGTTNGVRPGVIPSSKHALTCGHQLASSMSEAPVTWWPSSSRPMIHKMGSPRAALA